MKHSSNSIKTITTLNLDKTWSKHMKTYLANNLISFPLGSLYSTQGALPESLLSLLVSLNTDFFCTCRQKDSKTIYLVATVSQFDDNM